MAGPPTPFAWNVTTSNPDFSNSFCSAITAVVVFPSIVTATYLLLTGGVLNS